MSAHRIGIWALDGIGEVDAGADLAALIGDAVAADADGILDGDILVVTSKIVSKAEGRQLAASDGHRRDHRAPPRLAAGSVTGALCR